jgi:hypothetical protein
MVMSELHNEERGEPNDHELDNVSGGGIVDAVKSAWKWLTDDSARYDPVKACPQCYAGGGHCVRG